VDAFMAASATEAYWLQLEPRGIQTILQDMLSRGSACRASLSEVKQLARIFSRIVDAKSPFTAEHSLGVAQLSRLLAERMNVSPLNCDKIEIAGLLHDLGKLRVPDEVLDKPGMLDERERKIINTHSFETYQILRHIKGFEDIAQWAAYHHEEPDGNGYPFHLAGRSLPLEARILRVADIFQAMAQDRPYRAGLPAPAVLEFLNQLVAKGRLEAAIVQVAADDMPAAMAAARPLTHKAPLEP
jgi:putative nucleotidyltransferase with HDIG domain